MVVFLASDNGAFATGATFAVNGGERSLRWFQTEIWYRSRPLRVKITPTPLFRAERRE
ncbi:hypothetical protein FQV39_05725 [Bosea sp. F3-2]|nr:hypothetical protein FQV39_05725 [Bosea sp. F3-2]